MSQCTTLLHMHSYVLTEYSDAMMESLIAPDLIDVKIWKCLRNMAFIEQLSQY